MKSKYIQNGSLNPFQKLSKAQKYLIGVLIFILIFVGVYLIYRGYSSSDQGVNSSSSIEDSSKNGTENPNAVVLPVSKIQKVSNQDYPSILAAHKTQPNIGFNLALNQNESNAVYGFDQKAKVMKKLYNYLGLPYRATNTVTRIYNNFILQNYQLDPESNQSFTQVSWTYFDTLKNSNQKGYLGEIPLAYTNSVSGDQNKAIPENVIWYGFTNSSTNTPNEALSTKDSDYGKPEYIDKAVYIYTKSLKDNIGTYLKDLKNGLEFKISDQYCGFITFSKTDFWCLNDQSRLINLTTNLEIGVYTRIVATDRGSIYAVKNIDDQYSSVDEITFDNSGNPITKSNIYQTKQGQIISHIAYTNGQELLIQINRSQSPQFMEAIQKGENIKGLYTLQLLENGDGIKTMPRPEFDQFTVIF